MRGSRKAPSLNGAGSMTVCPRCRSREISVISTHGEPLSVGYSETVYICGSCGYMDSRRQEPYPSRMIDEPPRFTIRPRASRKGRRNRPQ